MDWKTLGPLVGAVAPLAGSILGGLIPFPGGSMIGQKFGEIIARQFGVEPKPEVVHAAISDTVATAGEETARAKINAAMEQARAEIDGFVELEKAYLHRDEVQLTQTGETSRAELLHQHWFFTGWRPFIGWVYGYLCAAFGTMVVVAAAFTAWRSPDPLKTLSDAWPILLVVLGAAGLPVGIMIPSRSAEKTKAMETGTPMATAKPPATPAPAKPALTPTQKAAAAFNARHAAPTKIIPLPPGDRT